MLFLSAAEVLSPDFVRWSRHRAFHMVRYHGVLSSHARLRSEVVPEPPPDAPRPRAQQLDIYQDNDQIRLVRRPWAWLVRHGFIEDASLCPKCDGSMRWLVVAVEPDDIASLLARHDLAAPRAPRPRAAPPAQLLLPFGRDG